ncbi:unnamed protein product [Calicophoron daubneyi]|uniref:C2H2-type domain-containing protein n=1 Tax=Calicophoron daubneyi TaxID=300641 RepID=A0AAV2TFV5_CALDB
MQLAIESDVCNRFHKLKDDRGKSSLTDSEFLSLIIDHLESCDSSCLTKDGCLLNGSKGSRSENARRSCPECKFTALPESLWNHFESAHAGEGCFPCTCGDSFVRMPDFLRHYIQCPVAATDLQDPTDDETPQKRVKLSPSPTNAADSLDESIGNSDSPPELYHSYRHPSVSPVAGPSEDKPYGCPKCFKGFKSKSLLDQHMHLHYPPRYKCRWCGNVYRWPPVYYHHKQKCKKRPNHNGSDTASLNDYKPGSEDSSFKVGDTAISSEQVAIAQRTLVQFMNFHGIPFPPPNGTPDSSSAPAPNGNRPACPFTCLCTEVFPTLTLYLEHMRTCPSILSASSVFENFIPQALFNSPNLGLDLSTQSISSKTEDRSAYVAEDLSPYKDPPIHQSPGVNGIFTCTICGKDFNSKLSLKQHVDGKHRPEGKYLCPTCGKRYRWGASFYYHKKTCIAPETTEVIASQTSELLTSRT